MTQETRVIQLAPDAGAGLLGRLEKTLPTSTEWRTIPHAHFQARAEGITATLYLSGKLVLQGAGIDDWLRRHVSELLDAERAAPGHDENDPAIPSDRSTIGSDETGKGDYFGPLVVTGAFVTPEVGAELFKMGVRDSKDLSEHRTRLLAGQIEALCDVECLVLEPERYNPAWEKLRNVNRILGEMHARVLASLMQRHPETQLLVVDRFGDPEFVTSRLATKVQSHPELIVTPRAERNLAVAAASIVARVRFVDALAGCSDACGTDLPKGAGELVDRAAQRVFDIGGIPLLSKVAKMHFRTTKRIHGVGA
ncbi:MAG: ribonuclease HIII [Planctomycetota bacterium]